MSFKKRHILFAVLALCAGMGFYGYLISNLSKRPNIFSTSDSVKIGGDEFSVCKSVVHLYFADRDNYYLRAEKNTIQAQAPVYRGKKIIENLIQGPRSGLSPTLPKRTALLGFYIDNFKTAYVDFSMEARREHQGGVLSELLSVYSIVNSLILNIDEIEAVKILLSGREAETFNGHVDLRNPLKADIMYIR